jgi:hypothetical protein
VLLGVASGALVVAGFLAPGTTFTTGYFAPGPTALPLIGAGIAAGLVAGPLAVGGAIVADMMFALADEGTEPDR